MGNKRAKDTAERNFADLSCSYVEWRTPDRVLARVRAYFGGPIPLDPATSPENPIGAEAFFTEAEDGLAQPWTMPVFLNPPYGKAIRPWLERVANEAANGLEILALLPAGGRFSTGYWQDQVLNDQLHAVCYVRGRIRFLDAAGVPCGSNTYPSMICGYNVDLPKFGAAFAPLGRCCEWRPLAANREVSVPIADALVRL
jgi:site-specific DNA-methyltransferase (adenine-specific)